MAIVSKSVSGFMYEETFNQVSLLWDVHPNTNRILLLGDSVGLLHGDERVIMSIPTPSSDFVFQATIQHQPTTLSDVGGVVVLSTTDDQVECQSYYDSFTSGSQYYQYIKVVRVNDVFTFYASQDGIKWNMIGNSELPNANRIGFFLDGPVTTWSNNFIVKDVSMYKSNVVTFNTMANAFAVSLKDSNNVEYANSLQTSQSGSNFYIDLTNVVLPMHDVALNIYNSAGALLVQNTNIDLCGGDIFDCVPKLDFLLNNVEIDPLQIVDIGRLSSMDNEYTLTIINKDTMLLTGKTLSVVAYSEFYRGGTFASIAFKQDDMTTAVYSDTLSIPDIMPDGGVDVAIKVAKDTDNAGPYFSDQYRFKILLQ